MLISEVAKIVIFELNLDYPAPETPPQLTWTFFCACYFAREYIIWALEYHVHWMYTMPGVRTKHDKFYTIRYDP
jgi:hypothetical protein